ncbi:hypothetical protein Patl1_03796 [Pistacia atlantica]|uniref:Uncharacterized protein n=1 Tax=Pistacia atlantica TaxID=434234 RepID=A0ACC1BTN3_9ROSI|nr:hypothetical protein Patl1_03796 [Pistacia atlantica]
MGKRRDRTMAAISNAGRRVKLDLSAEPSGDLGGSSVNDEVGKDTESKELAGLPKSPSSSGGFRQFSSKGLLLYCRVAVVLGTFISDQVGPCHCDILNESLSDMPNFLTSKRVGDFFWNIFLSVRQTQQNPLLLLGQYSDDEIDEESNGQLQQAVVENSAVDDRKQVKGQFGEGNEDKDVNSSEELAAQEVKQQEKDECINSPDTLQKPEVGDTRDSHATASGQSHEELNMAEQTSVAGTSAVQVIGDVSSGWKMVLHEESNQYYYWNIETGETSWEAPQVLVQAAELTFDPKTTNAENTQTLVMATHPESTMDVEFDYYSTAPTTDGSMAANMISQSRDAYECGPQMNERVEGSESEVLKDENGAAGVSQNELSSSRVIVDALSADGSLTATAPETYLHGSVNNEENKNVIDLSSGLVKQCEDLLDKLKSVEGSKGQLQGHAWVLKYVLEVETRLSDIKSLLSYGSALLPFWQHSERQLKRLEGAINEEIYQLAKSQVDEVMAMHSFCTGDGEDKLLGKGLESQMEEDQNNVTFSTPLISDVPSKTDSLTVVEKDVHNGSYEIVDTEKVASSGSPTRQLENGPTVGEPVNGLIGPMVGEPVDGLVLPDKSIPEPGFHAGEDVDMDVDMEVEDAIPAGNTLSNAGDFTSVEQHVQPNPSAELPSLPSEDASFIPPPPDEEWIPPPPPDSEQVPPPPPDGPPEPSYIPTTSYMETGQPLSYMEQYNLPYPDSSFTYYGQTSEVPTSNFYGNADGSQVDGPHVPIYYAVVPNTYNETASVMVNPVQSVAYYGLQDGTMPSVSVVSAIESSQKYHESGPMSDNALASDPIGSVDTRSEAVAAVTADFSVGAENNMGSSGVSSTSTTIQAPASISLKESVSVVSTNAVSSAAATATTSSTTKVQSKVRNKKRTVAVAPSLRSNKKVSSLVDKWKAAKEELNDDEDEPENAYEILEKKRRRAIEEWHAQQIASGEAKDNANFQPLGGDWREKVKRRRAQAAKEAARSPPDTQTDGNEQQPDLVDLSKNLPSGWQAYWDETSKQVYYGNTITSETTWTRPKK